MSGGKGTRLHPLTFVRPKTLIPLVNKPIIQYSIEKLKFHGFNEVTITVGYMWEHIKSFFKKHDPGLKLNYTIERWPLGTAGGVRKAKKFIDDTFLVLSGDVIIDADFKDVLNFHRKKGAFATLVLTQVQDPSHFGIASLNKDGKIIKYMEKPEPEKVFSNLANTGTYIFEPEIFDYLEAHRGRVDFSKHIFPSLIEEDAAIYGYQFDGYWNDVGRPETYLKATKDILKGRLVGEISGKKVNEEFGRVGNIWLGKDVKIAENVRIEGPVVIGNNCSIGTGTKISRGTVLGDNVSLEENVTVKGAVIFSNTSVKKNVYMENCIIDTRCQINKESLIENGAVVGSAVEVGKNSVIKSNRKITRAVKIFPGSIIDYDYLISPD
ncbi:MAG: NDP-sugar synthase [Methanobacteriaceae archaeon]|nr:NDP-sugar synthase [Methanobacteriaceae archaeon]